MADDASSQKKVIFVRVCSTGNNSCLALAGIVYPTFSKESSESENLRKTDDSTNLKFRLGKFLTAIDCKGG